MTHFDISLTLADEGRTIETTFALGRQALDAKAITIIGEYPETLIPQQRMEAFLRERLGDKFDYMPGWVLPMSYIPHLMTTLPEDDRAVAVSPVARALIALGVRKVKKSVRVTLTLSESKMQLRMRIEVDGILMLSDYDFELPALDRIDIWRH